jgi:aryl-alcohol dehydrogenase-like predicted oxidoreductase
LKIVIGTAQFGQKYGVTNDQGQLTSSQIFDVLSSAVKNNIDTLDTALAYGTSHSRIADSGLSNKFNIVTKLGNVPTAQLKQVVEHCCSQLQVPALDTVLLHDANYAIENPDRLIKLNQLKMKGLFTKLGVSVYHPSQAETLLKMGGIDVLQLPLNLLDQRFIANNLLTRMKLQKIDIHARSIFLQGVLLQNPQTLPRFFQPFETTLCQLQNRLAKINLTPTQASIGFVNNIEEVDKMVIGFCNPEQLEASVVALSKKCDTSSLFSQKLMDERLILPYLWQ